MPLNDSTKRFTGRMAQLHDTTENWNALRGFIPAAGEIFIFVKYEGTSIPIRVKQNGTWVTPSKVLVKQFGTWHEASSIKVKSGGSWH